MLSKVCIIVILFAYRSCHSSTCISLFTHVNLDETFVNLPLVQFNFIFVITELTRTALSINREIKQTDDFTGSHIFIS